MGMSQSNVAKLENSLHFLLSLGTVILSQENTVYEKLAAPLHML